MPPSRRPGQVPKPVLQPLYVDLAEDRDEAARPIHLGMRAGTRALRRHLETLREAGVNHVAVNLRFNAAAIEPTLERLASEILPDFS